MCASLPGLVCACLLLDLKARLGSCSLSIRTAQNTASCASYVSRQSHLNVSAGRNACRKACAGGASATRRQLRAAAAARRR